MQLYVFLVHLKTMCSDSTARLFEELKVACNTECDIVQFDDCLTIDTFSQKVYTESVLNHTFWLSIKSHFFGQENILNYINDKSKVVHIFNLKFLRDKYWNDQSGIRIQPSKPLYEFHTYGQLGEKVLLKYLNETDPNYTYVSSGKILLRNIPCFGATPDYLMLERTVTKPSKLYDFVKNAYGICEVKTSLTPDKFDHCIKLNETKIHVLLHSAYKYRYILRGSETKKPDVYAKKTYNWISKPMIDIMIKSYEETISITLHDFMQDVSKRFIDKTIYVNLLSSDRGKQILGQCLVFRDHRNDQDTIAISVFYLFLNRDDQCTPEYLIRFDFKLPAVLFDHWEKDISDKFYNDYSKQCSLV